jgi:cytochrome b pre-mRNA-processing protein 3
MVGREFRARHAMLTMHVWFLHKRLVSDANDPHRSLLIQEELFDIFWNDTKSRIRAEGVNELMVNQHLKDVQQYTFQHLTHYDHVFLEYAADPDKRFEEIAALIWIHVLLRDEEALDDQLKRLAAYVEFQFDNMIFQCPDEYFHEGRIDWGNLPEFSHLKDNSGKPLPPVPLHQDDVLPGTWLKHLTDAGQTYYWNPDKRVSNWERPTKP